MRLIPMNYSLILDQNGSIKFDKALDGVFMIFTIQFDMPKFEQFRETM